MQDNEKQLKDEYARVTEQERQKAAKKQRIEAIVIIVGVVIGVGLLVMFVAMISSGGEGGSIHERMQKMHGGGMIPVTTVIKGAL